MSRRSKHMVAKTVLCSVNALLAVVLLAGYIGSVTRAQRSLSRAFTALKESGAVNVTVLDRYVTEAGWKEEVPPMESLAVMSKITVEIWKYIVLPASIVLFANALIIGICWRRREDRSDGQAGGI